jgi:hypothetical protein
LQALLKKPASAGFFVGGISSKKQINRKQKRRHMAGVFLWTEKPLS